MGLVSSRKCPKRDTRHQVMKDAGTIMGLQVLCIINEPTVAAIAYGGESQIIYNLGGCIFDVPLLLIDDGVFEVLVMAEDTHPSGEDFNQHLLLKHKIVDTKGIIASPEYILMRTWSG